MREALIKRPIFVVGVPRSGTTLLAAMLGAHSGLSCGPETHFFVRYAGIGTQKGSNEQDCKSYEKKMSPRSASDFVCSIKHSGVPVYEKYGLHPDEIRAFLEKKPVKGESLLRALVEPYMVRLGKRRWVEKTPNHISFVSTIREMFPDALIIKLVRDPRDVALSVMSLPWGPSTLVAALLYWKKLEEMTETFFQSDELSWVLQFEKLLADPEKELRKLCKFIGEQYEARMLDTTKSAESVNSRAVPWKNKVGQPLDLGRVRVWKKKLPETDNTIAEALLADHLLRYGYETHCSFPKVAKLWPSLEAAGKYEDGLRLLSKSGYRFSTGRAKAYDAFVLVGKPDNWFGRGRFARVRRAYIILAQIAWNLWVRHCEVFWICSNDQKISFTSRLESTISHLLERRRVIN